MESQLYITSTKCLSFKYIFCQELNDVWNSTDIVLNNFQSIQLWFWSIYGKCFSTGVLLEMIQFHLIKRWLLPEYQPCGHDHSL